MRTAHISDADRRTTRRDSTETKASLRTTELVAYVVVVLGVLIVLTMADEASDLGTSAIDRNAR